MTTITMPQTFFCREHRRLPARGMGPAYCWRCEIREELWRSLPDLDMPGGTFVIDVPTEPCGITVPSGKSPGSLANLVPRWHPYVTDLRRTEADFKAQFPDDYAHRNWTVITFWREKVHLVSPT